MAEHIVLIDRNDRKVGERQMLESPALYLFHDAETDRWYCRFRYVKGLDLWVYKEEVKGGGL